MSDDREELVELITAQGDRGAGRGERPHASRPGCAGRRGHGGCAAPPTADRARSRDAASAAGIFGVSGGARARGDARARRGRRLARRRHDGLLPGVATGSRSLIDHTLLKPDATRDEIEKLCREAAQFCFASVCVNPNWVPLCRDLLRGQRRQGVHGDRLPLRRARCRT